MRYLFPISLCVLMMVSGAASAAQIDFTTIDTSTDPNAWSTKYGQGYYWLFDFTSGKVDPAQGYNTPDGQNYPSYCDNFYLQTRDNNGGGGGGGGGGQNGSIVAAGDLWYDLVFNDGKQFEFTALFYDKSYGADNGLTGYDVALQVRLLGYNDLDDSWHEITVDQLEHGIFLTWDAVVYDDDPNKTITLDVDWLAGAGVYGAAFFLGNVQDAGVAPIPEPATVGLVMFGLAGIFVRRKNR